MTFFTHRLNAFKKNHYNPNQSLYEQLKDGQNPKILIITCSDSRIVLDALLQTAPGDVFVIRNAGNIIPPYPENGGEAATIEYAMNALDIKHVIVCGHSNCGAMKGHLNPESTTAMPSVRHWLNHAPKNSPTPDDLSPETTLLKTIEKNVMLQLEHLKTFPSILKKIQENDLQLHGWVYEFEKGQVLALDDKTQTFIPLIHETDSNLTKTNAPGTNSNSSFTLSTLAKLSLSAVILSALVCLYLINPLAGFTASILTFCAILTHNKGLNHSPSKYENHLI